jgi:hypothetical protein
MTTVKFHKAVYDGKAVDEAVKVFAAFASFTLREEPDHWVVDVDGERARRVAGELGNYALGLTVKNK